MKNKKSIIIAIVIIISIIILTFFGYICKKEKFYLEDNYYNYDMKKVSYRDINKLEKEKKSFILFLRRHKDMNFIFNFQIFFKKVQDSSVFHRNQ